jgi:polyphosphate glucokinase
MDVLVIDIGGSHVKLRASGAPEPRRFPSGPELTPAALIAGVRDASRDWNYDVISVGFPGAVNAEGPRAEPGNLGSGWVAFDFERAFGKPVRVVNDAVMQALGAYEGGRMLFLGLGTGLGSALITEHVVVPLELGNLPAADGETMGQRLGQRGLDANGERQWRTDVERATRILRDAFVADYIVLGGGNAKRVDPLPEGTRRGGNEDAIRGGFRLWEEVVEPHARRPPAVWRVVR